MATSTKTEPKRGEIWLVNFNPVKGREISKTRPALVISSDGVGKLPLKIVAPLTAWKDKFTHNFWHIRIDPDPLNHLDQIDAVDTFQIRSISVTRFIKKKGNATAEIMEEVAASVAALVEYQ